FPATQNGIERRVNDVHLVEVVGAKTRLGDCGTFCCDHAGSDHNILIQYLVDAILYRIPGNAHATVAIFIHPVKDSATLLLCEFFGPCGVCAASYVERLCIML